MCLSQLLYGLQLHHRSRSPCKTPLITTCIGVMYLPARCMLHNRTVFLNTRAGEGQALTFELGIQNDGAHLLPIHLYAVFHS